MDVIFALNNISDELKSIPEINAGGCAVVAGAVAKHLELILPGSANCRVSNLYDVKANLNDVRKQITHSDAVSWRANGVNFGHLFVEFDWHGRDYHFDSGGVKLANTYDPTYGMQMYDGDMSADDVLAIAEKTTGWNTAFSRSYIPRIINVVDHHLKPFHGTDHLVRGRKFVHKEDTDGNRIYF